MINTQWACEGKIFWKIMLSVLKTSSIYNHSPESQTVIAFQNTLMKVKCTAAGYDVQWSLGSRT